MGLLLSVAFAVGWTVGAGWGCAAAAVALFLAWPLAVGLYRLWISITGTGGPEQHARGRLARFLSAHPDWHVRLYRTPGGLRVLAMQQTFDPNEPRVAECFAALGVDPIYARMCQRQNCFRARVSPKPWRIGIGEHLKPRPGVWPIRPERLPERRRWTEIYERAARSFASCSFVESLGSGRVHPAAADVQRLHDELCQANRPLPLA
jgi:hypothetical protein